MIPSNVQKEKKRRRWENTTIYKPSIYSYKCRGGFFLSSEDKGSEGTCRGLKSRLQLLSDMAPNTREGAIKDFTYMTDYELEDEGAPSLNQKTKSILISPALIYKEEASEASGSNVTKPPSSQLPEEELIKRQKWSCYGSTEVEYLVLQDEKTGTEHIAAVAPRNVGVSVRKIEADDGHITSIGVGWLNIVVDAGPTFVEDEEEERAMNDNKSKEIQQAPAPLEEVPPRPSSSSITRAKDSFEKFWTFSLKVADHMSSNVSWLYENMQDDFPSRTVSAGQKILVSLPRTVDRTVGFMGKMFKHWRDGDDGKE